MARRVAAGHHAGPTGDRLQAVVSRPGRQIFVFQIDAGAGVQEVVSILGPDAVFEHGLCNEAILGILGPDANGSQRITPERFRENRGFVQYLGALLAEHVYGLEGLQRAAEEMGDGYVYLLDARTPEPEGQVPPADIIAAIRVQASVLVAGSYQHNRNHRLLTEHGFFRLPPELATILQTDLRRRNAQPR